jgi:hypothetical protein
VPNPSGGRGVYVVEWRGVRAFCNPTVHDTILFAGIARLPGVNPAAVRGVALDVALGGYAGRDAIAAAQSVRGGDRMVRLLTDFLLLAGLVEQGEPSGRKLTRLGDRTPEFDRRAGLVLRRLAEPLGCSAAHLTAGLAAIGEAFAALGLTPDHQTARIPRLITRLKEAEAALSRWLDSNPDNDISCLGQTVTAAMKLTSTTTDAVLADVRSLLRDPMTLLKRWVMQPDDPIALAARCDWMLDGWERICLLWKTASSTASRRAALLEMAQLLPVLPREINDWVGGQFPAEALDQSCRVVSGDDVWRSGGAAFGLIQRNERLRALSW